MNPVERDRILQGCEDLIEGSAGIVRNAITLGMSYDEAIALAQRLTVEATRLLQLPEAAPLRKLAHHIAIHRGDEARQDLLIQKYNTKFAALVKRAGNEEFRTFVSQGGL